MARSRRKSLSQRVVGVATSGMPRPVRRLLGTRIVALLIILSIPVLLATGIVTVQWKEGRPKLSMDRQRAAEVKGTVTDQIQSLKNEYSYDDRSISDFLSRFGSGGGSQPDSSASRQPAGRMDHRVAEPFNRFQNGFGEQEEQGRSNMPTAVRR